MAVILHRNSDSTFIMTKNRRKSTWKFIHNRIGLVVLILALLFCVSGIILNHRELFSSCGVSRSLLPSSYRISSYNQGVVKGTLPLGGDSLLAYGSVGVWLTDSTFTRFSDFNAGFPEGVDARSVRNIVRDSSGRTWCAAQFGLYQLDGQRWAEVSLPDNKERLTDVTLSADGASPVVLTRSALYRLSNNSSAFERKELPAPIDYQPKVTLFKTIWQLHSGELFGIVGRIVVDVIALIIIFLCVTGIIVFLLPYSIRRKKEKVDKHKIPALKWNHHWHIRVGYWSLILTFLIAFTGTCLRPPLMIPFVLLKTSPVPGSSMASDNVWHDKLRGLRYNAADSTWLISTSEGFLRADADFAAAPQLIAKDKAPVISPMGINVFEPSGTGEWIIGSFSGMTRWNPATGAVTDYFTGRPVDHSSRGAVSSTLVSGYSADLKGSKPVVFDYAKGAPSLPATPELLTTQPMSLWNFALELHVGRCFSPILGPFSELYVFLSGLLLMLILISGYIIRRRHLKHRLQKLQSEQNKITNNKTH